MVTVGVQRSPEVLRQHPSNRSACGEPAKGAVGCRASKEIVMGLGGVVLWTRNLGTLGRDSAQGSNYLNSYRPCTILNECHHPLNSYISFGIDASTVHVRERASQGIVWVNRSWAGAVA